MDFFMFGVFLLFLRFWWIWKTWLVTQLIDQLPGPKSLPILGNALQMTDDHCSTVLILDSIYILL